MSSAGEVVLPLGSRTESPPAPSHAAVEETPPRAGAELLDALSALDGASPEEEEARLATFRLAVDQVRLRVWRDISAGDLGSPTARLHELMGSLRFLRQVPVPEDPPRLAAARALGALHEDLELARHALTLPLSAELDRKDRSESEIAVLRVLLARPGELLGRKAVHEAGGAALAGLSVMRVGQILASLYDRRLLWRELKTTQGARSGAFYRLTPQGKAVCERLGLVAPPRTRIGFDLDEGHWRPLLETHGLADRRRARPDRRRSNVFAVHAPGFVGPSPRRLLELGRWIAAKGEPVLLVDLFGEIVDHLSPVEIGYHVLSLRPLMEAAAGEAEDGVEAITGQLQATAERGTRPVFLGPSALKTPGESALRRSWTQALHDAALVWMETGGPETPHAPGVLGALRRAFQDWPGTVLVMAPAGLGEMAWVVDLLLADTTLLFVSPHAGEVQAAEIVSGNLLLRESQRPDPHPWGPVIPVVLEADVDAASDLPSFIHFWPPAFRGPLLELKKRNEGDDDQIDDRTPTPPSWYDDDSDLPLLRADGQWREEVNTMVTPHYRRFPMIMLTLAWWSGGASEHTPPAEVGTLRYEYTKLRELLDPKTPPRRRADLRGTTSLKGLKGKQRTRLFAWCSALSIATDSLGHEFVADLVDDHWVFLTLNQGMYAGSNA